MFGIYLLFDACDLRFNIINCFDRRNKLKIINVEYKT